MEKRVIWGAICLMLLLLPGACSNSSQSDTLPPVQIEGVNVDLAQLGAAFTKAPPEIQNKVNEGITKVRYRQYLPAMMTLDDATNSPGLTDKQKKMLNQVVAQLKDVVAKAGPGHQ